MIENMLCNMFKNYVVIFLKEYSDFLSKDQLEILKKINYQDAIRIEEMSTPFGDVKLGRIYFSNAFQKVISKIQSMPDYNTKKAPLHNKTLSSYIKYMCENGYHDIDYYSDILMYFVFKLVIKNDTPFVWGLINQEIKYLSIKYNLKTASLYAKEEMIVSRLTPYLKINTCRKLIFLDEVSSFKYLNDNFGYRYAKLVFDISKMISEKYSVIKEKPISNLEDILNFADDYDHLSYVDEFDYLLDFEASRQI